MGTWCTDLSQLLWGLGVLTYPDLWGLGVLFVEYGTNLFCTHLGVWLSLLILPAGLPYQFADTWLQLVSVIHARKRRKTTVNMQGPGIEIGMYRFLESYKSLIIKKNKNRRMKMVHINLGTITYYTLWLPIHIILCDLIHIILCDLIHSILCDSQYIIHVDNCKYIYIYIYIYKYTKNQWF